jgi:hypothetical protein
MLYGRVRRAAVTVEPALMSAEQLAATMWLAPQERSYADALAELIMATETEDELNDIFAVLQSAPTGSDSGWRLAGTRCLAGEEGPNDAITFDPLLVALQSRIASLAFLKLTRAVTDLKKMMQLPNTENPRAVVLAAGSSRREDEKQQFVMVACSDNATVGKLERHRIEQFAMPIGALLADACQENQEYLLDACDLSHAEGYLEALAWELCSAAFITSITIRAPGDRAAAQEAFRAQAQAYYNQQYAIRISDQNRQRSVSSQA